MRGQGQPLPAEKPRDDIGVESGPLPKHVDEAALPAPIRYLLQTRRINMDVGCQPAREPST